MMAAEIHNANPESTWVSGETQFSDLTQEEFAATYLTLMHDSEEPEFESIYEDDSCTTSILKISCLKRRC
jgi:hypothetical protein